MSSRSVHDAETIKVLVEVLEDFSKQLGPYSIKVRPLPRTRDTRAARAMES